jgi:signal transduction histidine kinase
MTLNTAHSGKPRTDPGDYILQRRIVALFLLAVVIPGVILCVMVIRATNREQAFLEKQFQTAFETETAPLVANIKKLLSRVQDTLDSTVPSSFTDAERELNGWKIKSPQVAVPFLFSRKGAFLRPINNPSISSAEELDFLKFNADFFLDRQTVDIYTPAPEELQPKTKVLSPEKTGIRGNVPESPQRPRVLYAGFDPLMLLGHLLTGGTGGWIQPREKNPRVAKPSLKAKAPLPYIKESYKFSQIIAGKQSGIISRIVDERIMLLFWKKLGEDRIVGCAVREAWLRQRIVELMPRTVTDTRILTILDQNGTPLQHPEIVNRYAQAGEPFFDVEITGMLPKWRVAVFLAAPSVIASKASTRVLGIGVLVAILFLTLVVGGTIIIRALHSELTLARQRTTFVANVSHELKTPLTSIRLFAEILREKRQPDPEKQRQYLDIMVSETERLTRLINNVLDFSRASRGKRMYSKRMMDVAGVCREITENQRLRLEHAGFSVSFESGANEAWYNIDAEAVKQALLNLLSNAEKYSPKEKWIRVTVAADRSAITVRVEDHGIGIPEKDEENIFKPFFRVDDSLTASVRGTGLGLTISRQIIQDHGGEILHRPNTPCGSVFTIMLPFGKE